MVQGFVRPLFTMNLAKICANHKNQAVNLHKKKDMRWQRKICFIVVCLGGNGIFLCQAQSLPVSGDKNLSYHPIRMEKISASATSYARNALELSPAITPRLEALPSPSRILEGNYYTRHFGFVCKKEWQFEKATHIPLRFRVGSLESCNFLEGKSR